MGEGLAGCQVVVWLAKCWVGGWVQDWLVEGLVWWWTGWLGAGCCGWVQDWLGGWVRGWVGWVAGLAG